MIPLEHSARVGSSVGYFVGKGVELKVFESKFWVTTIGLTVIWESVWQLVLNVVLVVLVIG